jgi:hypothetical protein
LYIIQRIIMTKMGNTEAKRTRPCTHCGRNCFGMEAGWMKCLHDGRCTDAVCIICQREGKTSCMFMSTMAPMWRIEEPYIPPVVRNGEQLLESVQSIPHEKPRENHGGGSGWSLNLQTGEFKKWNSFPNQ